MTEAVQKLTKSLTKAVQEVAEAVQEVTEALTEAYLRDRSCSRRDQTIEQSTFTWPKHVYVTEAVQEVTEAVQDVTEALTEAYLRDRSCSRRDQTIERSTFTWPKHVYVTEAVQEVTEAVQDVTEALTEAYLRDRSCSRRDQTIERSTFTWPKQFKKWPKHWPKHIYVTEAVQDVTKLLSEVRLRDRSSSRSDQSRSRSNRSIGRSFFMWPKQFACGKVLAVVSSIVVIDALTRNALLNSEHHIKAAEMNVQPSWELMLYEFEQGHNSAEETKERKGKTQLITVEYQDSWINFARVARTLTIRQGEVGLKP